MRKRIAAVTIAAALLSAPLALSTSGAALGAGDRSVDPSTLNPPPPASFNATCYRDGSHISCSVAFTDPDITAEPSGIVCNGTELLVSQTRSVVGKRRYDADGNLLQRHFREYLNGSFTNPETGLVALWTQHDTVIHDLAVPGDVTSGTEHVSGAYTRVLGPDGGTILNDAGTATFDEATGDVMRESQNHPFLQYFAFGDTSAIAPLCAAVS
jgi:hypothetical protein